MRWFPLVCLALSGWAEVVDDRPAPVPSMHPYTWSWAALYGVDDGPVVVLAMNVTAGTRLDLRKGHPPTAAAVTMNADGQLNDGLHLQDHARRIVNPDLPLVARWVRETRSNGFDTVSVTVPIPERLDDPLRAILVEHQAQLMRESWAEIELTDGTPRSAPAKEPLPPNTWRFTDNMLTEVTWWSGNLVSTLDWRVHFSGGAHANTMLHGHTWRRDGAGTWRLLSLEDYLGAPATWKSTLVREITDDLVRQRAGWFVDDKLGLRPTEDNLLRTWSVSGDGLVFSFSPYEVGPFSQGVLQVRIPWRTIGRERP